MSVPSFCAFLFWYVVSVAESVIVLAVASPTTCTLVPATISTASSAPKVTEEVLTVWLCSLGIVGLSNKSL